MGRTSRIPHRIASEERNRARVEREASARYYDRERAELRIQRGLI
ncbi:hypothetical protein [Agrococcus jenensis]|uniref:Uncharacterized protein n=1 Tax=Agrococcus jenensis TaxID=46353 RepID=A0A3N2AS98_9MICO|nr:hypothetical protein [Agrococcus jenensis]ROR65856.1 hypothetical protein EDD26_1226 [Agrococcus jenensis]